MKYIYIIGLMLFCSSVALTTAHAQEDERSLPWDIWLDPDTRNFREIQAEAEEYFRNRDKGRGTGYKQWKRWEYLMKDRLTEDGTITNFDAHNYRVSERYFSRLDDDQRTFGGFWFPLAPTDGYLLGNSGYNPGIGRVNVIAFHPTDQSIIYAGTPSGGLWRSNNEGTSWFPLTESIPRIGVSGIAIHPDNPNIIYILTGDGDGGDTRCIGVLKTFDGGLTWYRTGLQFNANDLVRGYKLAMKPGDPTTLFAVTTDGLYRTENSGGDWTVVRSGSYRDLEFKPGDAETIYLSSSNSFYRSTSGGDAGTFDFISSGLPSGESRVALAVSAANPTWVYYLAGGGGPTGSFRGLYRSTNSGTSFSTIITSPNILDSSLSGNDDCSDGCDQAGYDLAIAVDPNDGDEVITGGINVWRCEDIDVSNTWNIVSHWRITTANSNGLEYTHADIHELVYQDNNRLWCGSDGGVYFSSDDGQTWVDKTSAGTTNGLIATQYYRIAGTAANSNVIIGGTQDNGSNRWSGGNDITHFDGADGMDCMISQGSSAIQYHMRQRGGLRKSTNSGFTHSSIRPGNSSGAWVTPVDMDHGNDDEIWAGYRDTIYRSTNAGSSWVGFRPGGTQLEFFRYIWCAPSNSSVIYAATDDNLYRTGDNGSTWSNITGTIPVSGSRNITGITTDIDNSGDVWVTISGLTDGTKVYRSLDAGATWTNYSGSLPNVAMNCVAYDDNQVHDNAVYVGTDIGIFYRDGTMSDWLPFNNGLPKVPVFDIEVNTSIGKIRAGTYGRGIWESNDWSDCPAAWTLTNANAPATFPEGFRYYQASTYITSSRSFYGGAGTEVYYRAGDYVRLNEGFQARFLDVFRAWNAPCGSGLPEIPLSAPGTDNTLGAQQTIAVQQTGEGDAYRIIGGKLEAAERPRSAIAENAPLSPQTAQFDQEQMMLHVKVEKQTSLSVSVMKDDKETERLIDAMPVESGNQEVPIETGELPPGIYTLRVMIQGQYINFDIEID